MSEPADERLAAELAVRLGEAQRRVAALGGDPEVQSRLHRRLLAVSTAAKRDLGRASRRLDLLLADLDQAAGADPPEPGS